MGRTKDNCEDGLFMISKIAEICEVRPRDVKAWIEKGHIRCQGFPPHFRCRYVPVEELVKFFARQNMKKELKKFRKFLEEAEMI